MSTDATFPYAQNPAQAIPQVIDYDLVIAEPYPGICFVPTNVIGGTYQEIREVDGCFWFVTNAGWNPNSLQWEQNDPTNPTQPCYATVMCADGTFTRKVAAATNAINTAVAWIDVFEIDENGLLVVEPLTLTASNEVATNVVVTWNGGTSAKMIATEINVFYESSEADSLFEQFSVGGTPKWAVRKDGLLVVGEVPASAIVGGVIASIHPGLGIAITPTGPPNEYTIAVSHGDYVDVPNGTATAPQHVTGVKAFDPGIQIGSATGTGVWADAVGNIYQSAGAHPVNLATNLWEADHTTALIICIARAVEDTIVPGQTMFYDSGLVAGNTYNPTPVFNVDSTGLATMNGMTSVGDVLVEGNEHITGDLTVDGTIHAYGLTIPVTVFQSLLTETLTGVAGVSIYPTGSSVAVDGSAFFITVSSSDASLLATRSGQTIDITVNESGVAGNQKGTGSVAISTSGGGSPTTVTIPHAYASNTDYVAFVQLQTVGGGPFQATVSTYVLQVDGSHFQVYAQGDATSPQTVVFNWVTLGI